jgi:hypothetical protein
MRLLTGTKWGANSYTLRTIYFALIRSKNLTSLTISSICVPIFKTNLPNFRFLEKIIPTVLFGDNKNPHVEHHLLILSRSCFIDFQKAFDMLWKHGLLQKMVSLNIYGNMLSYVNDFLCNRILQVRINKT